MALSAFDTSSLSQQTAHLPQPLHIQKRPRKATFRKRLTRKSIYHRSSGSYVYGPLDDIIDEIRTNIWESPPDHSAAASLLGWPASLELQSTWTVTPLPVSRIPSDQPLTVRKNRESRSSASGSSMGEPMRQLRNSMQDDAVDGGPVSLSMPDTTPWPLIDATASHNVACLSKDPVANASAAHGVLESSSQYTEDTRVPTKRRPSVLRLFSGLSRLRRSDTGDASGGYGSAETPSLSPPSCEQHNKNDVDDASQEPSEDAVEVYIRKHARNGSKLGSIMNRIAKRLPTPPEGYHNDRDFQTPAAFGRVPTTLRAVVKVFPEIFHLSQHKYQEFWIAVEVEGALHNRVALPENTIDVILVVDNAYYVSKDCLNKALSVANNAFHRLDRGDRIALYTTHCTHQSVTGTRPDHLLPLGPVNSATGEAFHSLVVSIAKCGTQAWKPARPNPSMAEVILGITKSLEGKDLKQRRTHVLLLSPAMHVLHDVSKSFPNLLIHQMNPAAIPYRRHRNTDDVGCREECCKNVFISNWDHFQSLSTRIKRIVKDARSIEPIGEISQACIDIRARDGCEIVDCSGSKDIAILRLGQVHSFFVKVRTERSAVKAVDLSSKNPIFNSSLNAKDLRQQLQNAVTVGAVNAHLLDVQVYHQNTLHGTDCWNYTETPLLLLRDSGGLAPPYDTAKEVLKRQLFRIFLQLEPDAARSEAEAMTPNLPHDQELLKKFTDRMSRETKHYQRVRNYERECRQKLPMCPGPIIIEASPHEWLVDLWNKTKLKRQGIAVVGKEQAGGLTDSLHGQQLG